MLPTVTIESSRIASNFGMELLLGSVIVIAAIVWAMATHVRHHRHH